jgi:hypothetical protein
MWVMTSISMPGQSPKTSTGAVALAARLRTETTVTVKWLGQDSNAFEGVMISYLEREPLAGKWVVLFCPKQGARKSSTKVMPDAVFVDWNESKAFMNWPYRFLVAFFPHDPNSNKIQKIEAVGSLNSPPSNQKPTSNTIAPA